MGYYAPLKIYQSSGIIQIIYKSGTPATSCKVKTKPKYKIPPSSVGDIIRSQSLPVMIERQNHIKFIPIYPSDSIMSNAQM